MIIIIIIILASTNMIEIVSAVNSHASFLKYTRARKMPRQKVLFITAAP